MVKNGYYENECFDLALDHIEVFRMIKECSRSYKSAKDYLKQNIPLTTRF